MAAAAVINDVVSLFAGDPVFLAGSLVAEDTYGKTNAHSDVDLFCPNGNVLIAMGQKLIDKGFAFDDRFDRVWYRWLRYGFKTWHTNSLRMNNITIAPSLQGVSVTDEPQPTVTSVPVLGSGFQVNLVYKLTEGHPTTSLAQVLESFDFGLLGTGYELETGTFRDMRGFLFPGYNLTGPLPMMPNKRDNWRQGFISQYNGLREAGRYAKYHEYGYDLSLVRDDLTTGYFAAADYLTTHFDAEKQLLGKIYESIGAYMEDDRIDELAEASKKIDYSDSLDSIMEALE